MKMTNTQLDPIQTLRDVRVIMPTLYLNRDFVGQAVLRFTVAVLQFPALLVSFLRLSADTECCVP